jgi:tRNA pseudouridine38-40 synthase
VSERTPATSVPRFGVLITVAYDGRPFAGFARQTNARTIAGELDGAVQAVDPRASPVRGASRTDAGVHARGQAVAFDTERDIDARGWTFAITRHLPREIAIVRAARIEIGFVPRFRALTKTYRYVFFCSSVRDPFLEGRAFRVTHRLNHELMAREALALVGEHDFRAFRASADERDNTVRRLLRVELRNASSDPRCTELCITGNGFLYRMMRIIAGTLVDVGRGKLAEGAVKRALASGSRRDLGITAPPDGLYLEHVELAQTGVDAWPNGVRNID